MLNFPFLNRTDELRRLQRLYQQPSHRLAVISGRRRWGKSRLLLESLPEKTSVSFFCDEREAELQRHQLAVALSAAIPGFDRVHYPDWDSLLERWYREAPTGWVGSVKWQKQGSRAVAWGELERHVARFPDAQGRQVLLCPFTQKPTKQDLGPEQVLQALR